MGGLPRSRKGDRGDGPTASHQEWEATERKRRHHYVWRHYLGAWANDRDRLWCQRNGECFPAATTKVALRKHFYRLREMSDQDLRWVHALLIEPLSEPQRSRAIRWVRIFDYLFQLRRRHAATIAQHPALEREIDLMISNLEEDLHSDVEAAALDLLAALKRGDATPLADDRTFAVFASFIAHQYFRTPAMMEASVAAGYMPEGFNMEASWGVMRTILAINVGEALYLTRKSTNLTFLEAGPNSEFIAGDQPIINLGGTERLDLYYPLGPKRALRLTPEHSRPGTVSVLLSDQEVRDCNTKIIAAAQGQFYATSEAMLIAATRDAIEASDELEA